MVVALVVVVVLDAAGLLTVDCSRTVVVLVVGAGVSTTVVQEVKTVAARTRAGRRIRSFFIF